MSRIVIAGGGIAGLCTALALHATGHRDITVLERARSVEPLGSGINVMPQAVRELDRLGLLDDLRAISVETTELVYATAGGEEIWREPRGRRAGFRWPQLSIHRGWLQMCLARHVAERLGPDTIVTSSHVLAEPGGLEAGVVRYEDRSIRSIRSLPADLLIGADGIRSEVRQAVAPEDPGPRPNPQVVWRGMAWGESFLDGSSMVIAGDGTRKVVFYPIAHKNGRALINWAAAEPMVSETEGGNWNMPARPKAFAPGFEGWQVEGVDIAELMLASDDCFAYPMVDLDPLDHWSIGRTTLVGDAAHAMYPVGSNGATQSIIDGAALAHHLAAHHTLDEGLAAYELDRRTATRPIQAANRAQGPEVVVDLAAARVPSQFTTVAEAFEDGELAAIASRYARTTSLDQANTDSPYPAPTTAARLFERSHA
ncbi:FAD-dependent monooxygenase [Luteipulveratus mongoliensis]|uniref:FAD-binding domain-containing protein n=1 Tax=Luteipulveratus mongoliensis TaxID=571913 RepID=A0A0K1JE00_9MICO|nr:FAD-dependent monooxygenase [Luteipulveratus mongoliensis]AKU14818.1 hypothetical protein VV02_01275 [Luteipulveratus mongoliensis]